jgi:CRISPR-associated exonuclease Cas4
MGMPGMDTAWAALGITLLLLAVVVSLKRRQWQGAANLPAGEIVYDDMGAWVRQRRPLFSRRLGLTGKPDYLVEQDDGALIPVEIKSSAAPPEPYQGHIMQLAAYCLLVEEAYGRRPPHGIIQYRDNAFSIPYTPRLEQDLLRLLDEVRSSATLPDVHRDHQNWRRCAGCAHVDHCERALAPANGHQGIGVSPN